MKLLGDIYAEASRVLAWLGPSPCGSVFQEKSALSHYQWVLSPENENMLTVLNSCEWFERLWVVQGIALARNAMALWSDGEVDFGLTTHVLQMRTTRELTTTTSNVRQKAEWARHV